MMMNLTFTMAYDFALFIIAIILGLHFMGPEKDSAVCRGQK